MKHSNSGIEKIEARGARLEQSAVHVATMQAEHLANKRAYDESVDEFLVNAARKAGLTALPLRVIEAAMIYVAEAGKHPATAATWIAGIGASIKSDAPADEPDGSKERARDNGDDGVDVFVEISRNAAFAKRRVLEAAGLHWHGRSGTWQGRVNTVVFEQLKKDFRGRVTDHVPAKKPKEKAARAAPEANDAKPQGDRIAGEVAPDAASGPAAAPPLIDQAAAASGGTVAADAKAAQDVADTPAASASAPAQKQPPVPAPVPAASTPRPASPFANFRRAARAV
jgi:hypothetical protein